MRAVGLAALICLTKLFPQFFLLAHFLQLLCCGRLVTKVRRNEVADKVEVNIDLLRTCLAALDRSFMNHDVVSKLVQDGGRQMIEVLVVVKQIGKFGGEPRLRVRSESAASQEAISSFMRFNSCEYWLSSAR